ncbi:sugar ABC transporter substrate-binding protein [Streptomyces nitrosporeus]|uniref:Sugar ABC transporter substrate-binding protein n=1 Tax=Streptomyces nitrosporeus TaxID=28894 RepID=A0A5J6F5M6_9ACTN|nr:sugar ABC transporter substrate-binding protein [Streptomyces nitrosporeus]QEU71561.1 sugar ABC transporter substrate-binding protein [Streptomyces nitrosporeus]GGZ11386.1 solute-binding protein [Streptomyces nitrosporeus]
MNTRMRRAAVAVAATAMAVSLAACGSAKESGDKDGGSEPAAGKKGDAVKIGLLLPENGTARYEKFDKPIIEKKVDELTGGKGEVVYANAKQDATLQAQQVDTMITNKVDALILDAVDSKAIENSVKKAKAEGIPVIAFDRLAEGPIDAYTSFDNEEVGRVQGTALLEALKGTDKPTVVMMHGSITDPNAALFKKGAKSVLDGKVTYGKEYDTKEWKAENANANMEGAITALGKDKIDGVYSANDGMAGGIITALKAAGIKELPPVTGQDAELAGVQHIVTGEQYMSVYKPYPQEGIVAAEMAVALAKGEKLDSIATSKVDNASTQGIPSVLVPVVSLTKANIMDTVVKDGIWTVDEICTAKYKSACDAAGLK